MNLCDVQYRNRQMPQDVNYDRCVLKRPFPSDVKHDGSKRRPLTVSPSASDDGRTLKYTTIGGHRIACFVVGGEPRLCLPQLLRLIVNRVDVQQVESARSQLSVNLAQCEVDQLAALHRAKVLPPSVSRCGLVTLSDAARLVSGLSEFSRHDDAVDRNRKWAWLLSAVDDVTEHDQKWAWSRSASDDVIGRDQSAVEDCERFPVCHSCFGGCRGTLIRRCDVCVQCDECYATMSPELFVAHSHRLDAESRGTCHWGFDAARWRHYVMLNSTVTSSPEVTRRLQAALDDVMHDEFPPKHAPERQQVNSFVAQRSVGYDRTIPFENSPFSIHYIG